ncbi:MAG: hypothetical protein ACFFBD_09415 [Candidatus Hodarchaeota archaeon]
MMERITQPSFSCDICKREVVIGSDRVRIIDKQASSGDFFGTLITYHVESECKPNEIHVNIVVIDGDNQYRGSKYSAIKTIEQNNKHLTTNLRLMLGFGKNLSKVLTAVLEGHSIIICGDGPTTNLWASTLQKLFALSPYLVKPWTISKEELQKSLTEKPLEKSGEFLLLDESLLRQARKDMPTMPLVDLKRKKVYGVKEKSFIKDFVTKMLDIPPDQNNALMNLVNIQIEWLKRLLGELRREMEGSIVETLACPVGDLSETVVIQSVLDQILTEQVLRNLQARMKQEEFEVVIAHLLRDVSGLDDLVHKK